MEAVEYKYNNRQENRLNYNSRAATFLLIIICFAVYKRGLENPELYCSYNNIFKHGRWWTIFTALFVHGNLMHLLGNMLFLYLFGKGLENHIGPLKLILVFIVGGAISMLFCCFYYPPDMPCVGASGAICTILATLMLFNPWKFSLLLNFFPMPLGVAGFTYLLINIFGFYNDMKHPNHEGLQTAYLGHLMGFVVGIVLGIVLCPDWKMNLLLSIVQFIAYYLILLLIYYYLIR